MQWNVKNALRQLLLADDAVAPLTCLQHARYWITQEIERLEKEQNHATGDSVVPASRGDDHSSGHQPMSNMPEARCSCGAASPPKNWRFGLHHAIGTDASQG